MKLLMKLSLTTIGSFSLALGIMGIVLPLVPTTPLLLLAAACFVRSSDKLYHWLISNKWFGKYIEDFRSGRGIPLKAKALGVAAIWISISYSVFFVIGLLILKVIILLIASFFTWYILSFKTLR